MSKKYWILIVVLLGVNAVTISLYFNYKKNSDFVIERIKPYVSGYNDLKNNMTLQFENCQTTIEDWILTDSMQTEFNISDLFNGETSEILFCRISDQYCKPCNEYVLNISQNTSLNIVYLINQTNNKEFYNMKETYCLPNKTFGISVLNLSIESRMEPYLFVVDSNLNLAAIYEPQTGNFKTDYFMVKAINEMVEESNKESN